MDEPQPAAGSKDNPVWMKLLRDEEGIKWGNLVVMLAFTVGSAYLAARAQRAGTKPDQSKTLAMAIAEKRITFGLYLQRTGRDVERRGWELYERERPA